MNQNIEGPIVIENIRAEKIEGPKVLGKIELPVENDTRPKPSFQHHVKKNANANVFLLIKRAEVYAPP